MVFESDAASPVVFCRPRPLPPGDFVLRDFVPTVGERNPADNDNARPVVINPRPLF
jgi:hypothetical protein